MKLFNFFKINNELKSLTEEIKNLKVEVENNLKQNKELTEKLKEDTNGFSTQQGDYPDFIDEKYYDKDLYIKYITELLDMVIENPGISNIYITYLIEGFSLIGDHGDDFRINIHKDCININGKYFDYEYIMFKDNTVYNKYNDLIAEYIKNRYTKRFREAYDNIIKNYNLQRISNLRELDNMNIIEK
jgi:hypothetical protein